MIGCDGVIQTTGAQAASTDCNSPCKGDSTLLCGGPSRLEIFTNGAPSPAILTGVQEPTDLTLWAYVGCYSFVSFIFSVPIIKICFLVTIPEFCPDRSEVPPLSMHVLLSAGGREQYHPLFLCMQG